MGHRRRLPSHARVSATPTHASVSCLLCRKCCASQLCVITRGLRQGGQEGIDLRWRGRGAIRRLLLTVAERSRPRALTTDPPSRRRCSARRQSTLAARTGAPRRAEPLTGNFGSRGGWTSERWRSAGGAQDGHNPRLSGLCERSYRDIRWSRSSWRRMRLPGSCGCRARPSTRGCSTGRGRRWSVARGRTARRSRRCSSPGWPGVRPRTVTRTRESVTRPFPRGHKISQTVT
jgi:hypothetical protein